VKKGDIPVGGGKIFGEDEVVITQPTAGNFVGLSAICTHQQCIVAKVENKKIICGCHGSEYNFANGSVVKGPAPKALAKKALKIEGEDISLA
jgi:Rieske Fe-S protein